MPIRPAPAGLLPARALGAGDVAGQVAARQPLKPARPGDQGIHVETAFGVVRQRRMGRTALANGAGQAPGVDAADSDPAVRRHPCVQIPPGPPARRCARNRPDHHARGLGCGGFVVFGVDAGVADVREGENHDLPRVGRIGHDLLIAGHRGVEAHLGNRCSPCAKAMAMKMRPIRKSQAGGGTRV